MKQLKRFRARIVVTLQEGMLDPQGEAVARVARETGLGQIEAMRCGKVMDLELHALNKQEANEVAENMRKTLLTNPTTEQSELVSLEEA